MGQPTVGSNPTPSARYLARVTDDEAMALALDEARLALDHGDVPVGAVVLVDGRVVARRHNEREELGDPTAHAEILALRDAAAAVRRRVAAERGDDGRHPRALPDVRRRAGGGAGRPVGLRRLRPEGRGGGSLYNLCADPRLNHEVVVEPGVRADEAAALLGDFFGERREGDPG